MLFSTIIFAVLLIALIGARNIIAANLVGITILVSGNKRLGLWAYSFIFLPGVIIHEISHFFVAAFLGVQTGDITIFPSGKTQSGRERLGSVQIAKTDFLRSSLIGVAPLFVGSLFIVAITRMQFPQLTDTFSQLEGSMNQLLLQFKDILSTPLNLLWFYLIFAISNTMFVSQEDRRAWPVLFTVLGFLALIGIWTGTASSVAERVSVPISTVINILSSAFILSLALDALVVALLTLIKISLEKLLKKRLAHQ